MKYADKLKDPRWQKRRIEILERDKFTCQYCGNKEETLNVHHLSYVQEPWDCPRKDLITLCESCHEAEHHIRKEAEKALILILKDLRFSAVDILQLGGLITERVGCSPGSGAEFIRQIQ